MMALQEIVAVIREDGSVSTDLVQIRQMIDARRKIHFVNRQAAQRRAVFESSETWDALSRAPTLLMEEKGVRFFPSISKLTQWSTKSDPKVMRLHDLRTAHTYHEAI